MPIGIQRLNAQRPQPSSQIIFIKPLPGPGEKYAQDFLERIAAICHPIMKANHLSIMTLEEHEPNPEFIGRNFNAGEIIQLVLKAPYTGHWLSFRSVQMVMMHELAHCMQMNHSGAFWKINNQYKGELKELWARGYTGDGLWGKGQTLLSGEYHTGTSMESEFLPANLCGGTFRTSRKGKRKRAAEKPKETYAERQQRRIRKKFGVNGQSLGDDESTRVKLENGKKPKGKPRVAGSARGRELRAAAASARFEQVKEEETKKEEESLFGDSDADTESSDAEIAHEAVDINGSRMRDGKGRGMIKVCGDQDQNNVHVKEEIKELQRLNVQDSNPSSETCPQRPSRQISARPRGHPETVAHRGSTPVSFDDPKIKLHDIPQYVEQNESRPPSRPKINIHRTNAPLLNGTVPHGQDKQPQKSSQLVPSDDAMRLSSNQQPLLNAQSPQDSAAERPPKADILCPICSMTNGLFSLLCIACSHVLNTDKVTRCWRCQSDTCKGSEYINAADCGICGVCGARKSEES